MTIHRKFSICQLGINLTIGLTAVFLVGCRPAADRMAAHVYLQEAYEQYQEGEYETCVYKAGKALSLVQNLADAYLMRAYGEMGLNNFSNALLDVNAALSLQSNSVEALVARTLVYQKIGDLVLAMADADRAVALRADAVTLSMRLDLRGGAGDTDGVKEDLERLAEIGPEDPSCLNARAWSMMLYMDEHERNSEEILVLAEKAVELHERKDPASLDTLACALADVGRVEDAINTVREALTKSMVAEYRKELDQHLAAFESGVDWRTTEKER